MKEAYEEYIYAFVTAALSVWNSDKTTKETDGVCG